MALKVRDISAVLIERIEAAHPRPAHFEFDETVEWPADVLSSLLKQEVLVEAERAEAITCPGCEQQCRKRVEVRRTGKTRRAFIMCDEEPNHGRVPVSLESLQLFETDLDRLARLMAKALKSGPPRVSRNLTAYALGTVKGRQGKRPVFIAIEDGQLVLGVGEQREPMTRIIAWGSSELMIDVKHISRLADRKGRASTARYQRAPDRSRQAARKNETRKRDRSIYSQAKRFRTEIGGTWSKVAAEIAGTELARNLTVGRVRRIITEQRRLERENPRSKPRTRN